MPVGIWIAMKMLCLLASRNSHQKRSVRFALDRQCSMRGGESLFDVSDPGCAPSLWNFSPSPFVTRAADDWQCVENGRVHRTRANERTIHGRRAFRARFNFYVLGMG